MRVSKIANLMNFRERFVGLEFENPILDSQAKPISEHSVQTVWKSLSAKGWTATVDPNLEITANISKGIGPGLVNVNSDCAAGNLEIAFPPIQTLNDAKVEFDLVLSEIIDALASHDMRLLGFGIQPATIENISTTLHRNRLHHAFAAMGASTYTNNAMMLIASAHQTGISVRLEELISVVNELTKVSGLVVALCANSPISDWAILGWKEWRMVAWKFRFLSNFPGFDQLAGFSQRPFKSISDFLRFHWESPPWMILPPVRHGEWIIPERRMNCAEYLRCTDVRGTRLSGEALRLTVGTDDINSALSLFWPFAKPHLVVDPHKVTVQAFMDAYARDDLEDYLAGRLTNCYIEYRIGSAAPVGEEMALPALTLGLINNVAELARLTSNIAWADWRELLDNASVLGMQAQLNGKNLYGLLSQLVEIAEDGLAKRGFEEEPFLAVLKDRIESQRTPADCAIAQFVAGGQAGLLHAISYQPSAGKNFQPTIAAN